ncbi:MAG TPA: MotA/TolQ/ExbB proton channel family protein [Burkholderiales bacterium]|nr:MotA/TolQ/ExbB proton channel family protein [Burkholderiales bacterium]
MFEIIRAAGWPIWPIIAASLIALTIIIERLIALRSAVVAPPDLLPNVVQEYEKKGVQPELLDRLSQHSPLGQIFAAGLKNVRSPRDIMKDSIEEAGRAVAHQLDRFLTTLGTIASMAPLLGLLGTIIGMIEIFGATTSTGLANPAQLASGISVALYNAAFGIIVAIPALIFFRYFRAKAASLIVEMEMQAIKLVEIVHGERRT